MEKENQAANVPVPQNAEWLLLLGQSPRLIPNVKLQTLRLLSHGLNYCGMFVTTKKEFPGGKVTRDGHP